MYQLCCAIVVNVIEQPNTAESILSSEEARIKDLFRKRGGGRWRHIVIKIGIVPEQGLAGEWGIYYFSHLYLHDCNLKNMYLI